MTTGSDALLAWDTCFATRKPRPRPGSSSIVTEMAGSWPSWRVTTPRVRRRLLLPCLSPLCVDRRVRVLLWPPVADAAIDHPFWWDARQSGGPVVEQATHLVDLARFLGGHVDTTSVSGVSIPATSDIGRLECIPEVVDEASIPEQFRLPRVHSATWRFNSGGVGTLTHGLLLRGEAYDTGLEVWCDGLRIAFEDLYVGLGASVTAAGVDRRAHVAHVLRYDEDRCRLRVRRGSSDEDEVFHFKVSTGTAGLHRSMLRPTRCSPCHGRETICT